MLTVKRKIRSVAVTVADDISGIFQDRMFWLITGIALILRLAYWLLISGQSPMEALLAGPPDSMLYLELANDFTRFTVSNEHNLYMTGFGYSAFLAALLLISAKSYYFALTVQVAMSSLSAGLVYYIGRHITGQRAVGIIAGLINATSLTAVALSVMFLTEPLFFFVLCVSVIVFLRIVERPRLAPALALGVLIAYATFTRSAGQLLPIVLFLAVLITPRRALQTTKTKLLLYIGVSSAVAVLFIGGWMMRNYVVHETAVVAGTGLAAAWTYLGARVVADNSENLHLYDVRDAFEEEMLSANPDGMTPSSENDFYARKLKELFFDDPYTFIVTFLKIVRENMFAPDGMTEYRMNQTSREVQEFVGLSETLRLDYLPPLAMAIGFVMLLLMGRGLHGMLFGALYAYFLLISGFTFWQGSRICYPAQLPWSLLFGVSAYYSYRGVSIWIRRTRVYPFFRRITLALGVVLDLPNRFLRFSARTYRWSVATLAITMVSAALGATIWSATRPPNYSPVKFTRGHSFSGLVEVTAIRLEEKDGSTVAILFDLEIQAPLKESFRFFLHFYPEGGGDMLNRDLATTLASRYWKAGDKHTERRRLDLPKGEYAVSFGMFNGKGRLGQPLSLKIRVK